MTKRTPEAASSIIQIKPLYLARAQAALFLSLSESTLEQLASKGDAPKPRKLSSGRSGWLVEELEAWGRERPVSDLLPAVNSGYGRAGKGGDVSPEAKRSK